MASLCVGLDHCRQWEKTGKSEVLKLLKSFSKSDGDFESTKSKDVKRLLYEVTGHALKDNLKQEQLLSLISELKDVMPSLISQYVDILSLLDQETQCSDDLAAQRDRFLSLAKSSAKLVGESLLKERLDQDTLESLSFLKLQQFQPKYVKMKTKLYYKQQKFNLLREENEGYAKLITELLPEPADKVSPAALLENIKSLIGCFNLDPNRVLDIILEAFEWKPEMADDLYVPLLKAYTQDADTVCQIIGFKFQFYQQEEERVTPASLYAVTALLLHHGLIDLAGLYPHLSPDDQSIKEAYKKEIQEARQNCKKTRAVVTADRKEEPETTDELPAEKSADNNQKTGLIESLLALGAWKQAKLMMDRLPQYLAASNPKVARALCQLIRYVIDPMYQKHSGLPAAVRKPGTTEQSTQFRLLTPAASWCELRDIAFPLLSYLGCHLANDPILLVKVIRLIKGFVLQKNGGSLSMPDLISSEVTLRAALAVIDEEILPSLSLCNANCCVAEEIWLLLQLFPYHIRYRLYGQWKNDSYVIHSEMIKVRAGCLKRAKYILSRLTTESVKQTGRHIGKLSHGNPAIFFDYMLTQIQVYDNMIGPIVDSLKYLTSLSYDVLTFCLIEAMSSPEKEKMKYDDTNMSKWLQCLANFTGSLYRKYQMELGGLLQYICNQLKAEKSFDLLILREVVQKMGGVEVSDEATEAQTEAACGGDLLRQEGGYFAQAARNAKKAALRLKEALLSHELAVPLCLLMGQQRECVIYKEQTNAATPHLKLVGKMYDQCLDTLVQFGTFLSMQLSAEEFARKLPSVDVLVSEFHMAPDVAFFLSRATSVNAINAKYEQLRKQDKANKEKTTGTAATGTTAAEEKHQRFREAVKSVLMPIADSLRPLFPAKTWEDLSVEFYVTFWLLTNYDLLVPVAAYERQVALIRQQVPVVDDSRDQNAKRKKEAERCSTLIAKLREEERRQTDHVERVTARLRAETDKWFPMRSTKNETIAQFLQLCIFPRCILTTADALFCARFIHILHDLHTPNFSTLICYDRIFNDITYSVTCCTENEAHRYGRFLCSTLETIMHWHSSKEIFDKECANYPGFVTVFRKGSDSNNKADQLDYENYRHVCHKWHFRITKAMVTCLESGNFIQIRNALIVLTKILPFYPRISAFGQALERRVDRIYKEEREKRPDLYALAYGYAGQLKARKASWIGEADFHVKENPKNAAAHKDIMMSSGGGPVVDKDAQAHRVPFGDMKTKVEASQTAILVSSQKERVERSEVRENRPKTALPIPGAADTIKRISAPAADAKPAVQQPQQPGIKQEKRDFSSLKPTEVREVTRAEASNQRDQQSDTVKKESSRDAGFIKEVKELRMEDVKEGSRLKEKTTREDRSRRDDVVLDGRRSKEEKRVEAVADVREYKEGSASSQESHPRSTGSSPKTAVDSDPRDSKRRKVTDPKSDSRDESRESRRENGSSSYRNEDKRPSQSPAHEHGSVATDHSRSSERKRGGEQVERDDSKRKRGGESSESSSKYKHNGEGTPREDVVSTASREKYRERSPRDKRKEDSRDKRLEKLSVTSSGGNSSSSSSRKK